MKDKSPTVRSSGMVHRASPRGRPALLTTLALFAATLPGVTPMPPAPDFLPAFPLGLPNDAYARYFKGQSFLAPLTKDAARTGVPIANVTFEPGCRNHWHRHTGGQVLVCVAGEGLYQERGRPARHLRPGDVVEIPPDTDHWHGATAERWFSHLSVECHPETNRNTWLEPVSDADYAAAQPQAPETPALDAGSAAIVRFAACAASGNALGLTRAAECALDAGLTVNALKEVCVQLYAYAGFPRCLNAHAALAQTLKARAARGITDPVGQAPKHPLTDATRERVGRETRAALAKTDPNAPEAEWQRFAPGAERYLKEHLFGDIFARGVLSHHQRELATVAFLAAMEGAGPQLRSHLRLAGNVGWPQAALDEAVALARAVR